MADRLSRVLAALLPSPIAEDLSQFGDDPNFVAEQIKAYLTASPDGQADMLAFHTSDGVAVTKRLAKKHTSKKHDEPQGGEEAPREWR